MHLVVGLGNPGTKYEKTRHNLGYMVAAAFAARRGFPFKKGWKVKGQIASGVYNEKKVEVLLPTTYMNLSGKAVIKLVHYYKIPLEQVIVIVDDIYVKFGSFRLRKRGGTGGHNGMRSIEQSLQSQEYPRLRMGIGHEEAFVEKEGRMLEDFVLAPFDAKEMELLPTFVERGVALLEKWLDEGIDGAIHKAGEYGPL